MTDPADLIGALRTHLLADPSVSALAAQRIFGQEIPPGNDERPFTVNDMPERCVVLCPAGGGALGRGYQDYGDRRVDTLCYGRTPREAEALHRAVRAAMKSIQRIAVNGVLIHWARISSDGSSGREPDTDWPVTFASFQVLASDWANA